MTELGLSVFAGGAGPQRFRRMGEIAAAAEDAGFDSVWTSELYHRSATVPLAVLAGATERAAVGCNIAYGVGRTPLVWAAEARDLDELSGGRFVLGLGNGTAGMMEHWHGVSGEAPAVRMADLVTLLRKLWRLDLGPVRHDGRFYHVDLVPTTDIPPPQRERLPIWVAGVNEGMVRAAGRVADGLVGHPMFTHRYVEEFIRPTLAAAATSVGRDPAEITVSGIRMCAVGDDVEAGRARVAYAVAQYAASRVYDRMFALHGWTADQQRIREAAKRRDLAAMAAAVPDELIEAVGLVCPSAQFAEQVRRHCAGYDQLTLVAAPWGLSPEQAESATLAIVDGLTPSEHRSVAR
jgi:probable F420-dependent oxidoreductase